MEYILWCSDKIRGQKLFMVVLCTEELSLVKASIHFQAALSLKAVSGREMK